MGSAFLLLLATSGLLCGVVLGQTTTPTTTIKPTETTKLVKGSEHSTKPSSHLFWSSTRKALPKESHTEITATTRLTTATPKHVSVSEKVEQLLTMTTNQPGGGSSKGDCNNETLEWQKDIDDKIERLKELVEILLNNSSTQPIKGPCIVKSTAVSYIESNSEQQIGGIHLNNKPCVRCSSKALPEQNLTPGLAICVFDPSTCLPIDSHIFNTGDEAGRQGDFFAKYLSLVSGDAAVAGVSCGDFTKNLGDLAKTSLNALNLPLDGLKENDKVTFVCKSKIPSKALMESDPSTSGQLSLNSTYSIAGDTNQNFWFLKLNETIGE